MKVLFWFRKSEAKQINGNDPDGTIQCRVTIDSDEIEIGSTKINCKKSAWDATGQKIYGNYKYTAKTNQKLSLISTNLLRLYDVLNTKYDHVSPALVKEYYLSKRKFNYSIQECKDAFFIHREKMVEKKAITESTLTVNENYARHILDFCEIQKITKPLQIGSNFFNDLFEFLIDDSRCGERMARKVACFAKQVLKWSRQKGMCPDLLCFGEEMPGFAESEEYIDTTHLSIRQLDHLFQFDFNVLVQSEQIIQQTADTLSSERDAFVFNCFTGMHHCDYNNKAFNIEPYYGSLFLTGKRQKTKKRFSIKLLEPAVTILQRYNNLLAELPTKSNQKRNDTLKLIAIYTGIPLRLSTKIARKTFCDLALNEMLMSADDVAACLGLTNTKYLKNYGRIRERRLMKTMKSWSELQVAI